MYLQSMLFLSSLLQKMCLLLFTLHCKNNKLVLAKHLNSAANTSKSHGVNLDGVLYHHKLKVFNPVLCDLPSCRTDL